MQILCATNFTQPAREAADVAAAIAKKWGFPLRLFFCVEDWGAMGEVPVGTAEEGSVQGQLNEDVRRLRATGITVHGEIRVGNVAAALVEAVKEVPTKLIVVGAVTETFPSVSLAVFAAKEVPIPVMIVQHAPPLLKWLNEAVNLRVLCGVNFTQSADAALAFLPGLKALGDISLSAGHISVAVDPSADAKGRETLESRIWDRLRTVLGNVAQFADVPASIYVRGSTKRPADEFVDLAEGLDSDLLVMGTHQYQGLKRLLTGSFSQAVIHRSKTNILCVPLSTYHPPASIPAIHRVLVATDFSDCGNAAVKHALGLVRAGDAVRLFHVCHSPALRDVLGVGSQTLTAADSQLEESIKHAETKLQALIPRSLAATQLDIHCEAVVARDVAVAIGDAADRFRADVICIGTKGHTRAGIALLGSTVQAVVAQTRLPVFAVTPPAQ